MDITQKITPTFSICICTMNRWLELKRCLDSIVAGTEQPLEILVSDDSFDPETTQRLCEQYPLVHYVRGPQTGQGANRDFGGRACRSDFVCYLDDDAILAADFLALMEDAVKESDGKTIYTGNILERGVECIRPQNITFWGHFGDTVTKGFQTVNFNTNAFPRSVFEIACFDGHLKYGYEDSDFCTQAISAGYRIIHIPEACNTHLPSSVNRAYCYQFREESRYYTSLKRYLLIQRKPILAMVYFLLAPLHQALHHVKTRTWRQIPRIARDMFVALSYLQDEIRLRRKAQR